MIRLASRWNVSTCLGVVAVAAALTAAVVAADDSEMASHDRPSGARPLHCAGDGGTACRPLRSRAREGRYEPCAARRSAIASCCSCMARERRRKWRSTCRTRTTAGWPSSPRAGFDVFSMDITGYGRSTRPAVMNDPCNLAPEQQAALVPASAAPCHATLPAPVDDDRVGLGRSRRRRRVLRALRRVDRVSMVAWSLGARAPAATRRGIPSKVKSLVLLAPALQPRRRRQRRRQAPGAGAAMNTQSRSEFTANWDRQVGCPISTTRRCASRMARDAGVRPRGGDVGSRRAPRAVDDCLGLEQRDGRRRCGHRR